MESFFNIKLNTLPRYALTPGDHSRVNKILAHLDNAHLLSQEKGYILYIGEYFETKMVVCSTGMGGPTTAVCVEELGRLGVDTFIRIGSCGTMNKVINCGDVIISTGAYRSGGTSNDYAPIRFPAIADVDITRQLLFEAKLSNHRFHVGLGMSEDADYKIDYELRKFLGGAGVLTADMESDTLFVLSLLKGWRAGAIFACDGTAEERRPEWGIDLFREGEESAIRIALNAMKMVAEQDNINISDN